MKINFSDAVKLASKGFKPKDIEAIKELDENKFSKDDILSLVGNGYSAADLKKLCDTFSGSQDPEDETDDKDANEDNKDKPGKGSDDQGDHADDSDSQEDDDIDYKALYEKEKKLREKLQHDNASSTEGPDDADKESDFDIAVRIAQEL